MWNRADNEPDFHTGSFFVYKVVGDERGTADEPGLDLVLIIFSDQTAILNSNSDRLSDTGCYKQGSQCLSKKAKKGFIPMYKAVASLKIGANRRP